MLDTGTLNTLYTLRRRGIKVGLHRTRALLRRCGDPHNQVPVIHVAGTNGKGSTAAMISSILRKTGRNVGLYTSPHLVTFNERIRVNGASIPDGFIRTFLNTYREDIDHLESTFFETTTAISFTYFADRKVDVAVVEVGLGGRLDSSNVSNSVVSVLTPIDYDHMEFLGHDLVSIAREKCGILKEGIPVVVSSQRPSVSRVIRRMSREKGSRLAVSDDLCPVSDITIDPDFTRFRAGETDVALPLLGHHQVVNAQTAVAACRVYDPDVSWTHLARGLHGVSWPARLQRLSTDPPVYYDVAHNPHSLKAVVSTLEELCPRRPMAAVCALKRTKSVHTIARILKNHDIHVVTTAPEESEFFAPDILARELSREGVSAQSAPSLTDALRCRFDDRHSNRVWLIFGSHYIAGGVFDEFGFSLDEEMN